MGDSSRGPVYRLEPWLLIFINGCYVFYILKCFYLVYSSSKEKEEMLSFDLHPSWWFGRRMDDSDFEWRYFADFYSTNLQLYLLHSFISLIINSTFQRTRLLMNIAFSVVAIGSLFGLKHLTFIVASSCLVYLAVLLFSSKLVVWVLSLLILSLLNFKAAEPLVGVLCEGDNPRFRYASLVYAMTMSSMRLVSLGSDLVDIYRATGEIESFYRTVSYNLYFPFYLGPFVSYKDYIKAMVVTAEKPRCSRVKTFLKKSVILIGWWVAMEIGLHYFYTTALLQEEYFLLGTDSWTLFAISIVQVAFFNIKYKALFGLPILFGSLDGVAMPAEPSNMLVMYRSSDIWKKFDNGLYNFVRNYLYIPLGGSHYSLSQSVLALFVCFSFIGFWHGTGVRICLWALINYLTILLEKAYDEFLKSNYWRNLQDQFGLAKAHLLQTLIMVPIALISIWSVFLFICGKETGFLIYKKLMKNSTLESRVYIVVLTYVYLLFAQSHKNGDLTILYRRVTNQPKPNVMCNGSKLKRS